MKNPLYKQFDIWRRAKDEVYCYRCFQGLDSGLYYVQSCDILRPGKPTGQAEMNEHLVELFCEEDPAGRIEGFSSLQEAIEQFDAEFDEADELSNS